MLVCTPQKEKRGYQEIRVPLPHRPSASGIYLSWAMLMRPRTVLILPHTITGPQEKKIHWIIIQCALTVGLKNTPTSSGPEREKSFL